MLKTVILAALAFVCVASTAEARPKVLHCIETGTVMAPQCNGRDFLAGVKSIKVTMKRERHSALSGRPAGCPPRAWCGCFLSSYLGIHSRNLWVARNWARVGHPASGPQAGAVVVWPNHVGLIRAAEGGRILVLSGNDGRAVRERWRSTRGVIAYRVTG